MIMLNFRIQLMQIISRLENAHSSGINALMNISPTNLASGECGILTF